MLNALLQATDQMLVYLDCDFNFVWVNSAYAETCKMPADEMVGKNHFALYPDAENEIIFRHVRDTGEALFYKDKPFEFPDQPDRGTTYWDWSLTPVKSSSEQVVGLVFSLRDTTQKVRAELALRESEARFRMLFDKAPVAIYVHDPISGKILHANRRALDSYGYSEFEELLQGNIFTAPPYSENEAMQLIRRTMEEGPQRFEWRSIDRHGIEFWEDMLLTVVTIEGQPRVLAMATDITERKKIEQELLDADKRKDEFLAMLAHELRNPLTPISNAAHVIGRVAQTEPQIKWAQEVIKDQVNHLARMVDDLLDVSRIARGKITLKRETVAFTTLVEQAIALARPMAERKGQQLIVRLPEQTVLLECDPVRLNQVLFNLLDNAVKYTPDGGYIEFAAQMVGQEIEFSVRDNGMGIAAALLPRVFDLFQQGERTLDRTQGGLGIGLTLVQRLVCMHDGRVTAYSAGQGLGATFTVCLPVMINPAASSAPDVEFRNEFATSMRVLVVDDDHAVADSMVRVLELDGYTVRVAYTGQAALELTPVFLPQVVLLDIGLDGLDGFETAKRLRALPEGHDLCLVAVTGYGDNKTRTQALLSGCDHFLVKPVKFAVLSGLLAKVAESTVSP